jgi:hypothetical protein
VAVKLLADFPRVETLMTLSPLPGFRPWLKALLQREVQQHLDGVRALSRNPLLERRKPQISTCMSAGMLPANVQASPRSETLDPMHQLTPAGWRLAGPEQQVSEFFSLLWPGKYYICCLRADV